ncbi:nucleoside hydrolase [Ponticoccus sp. SC2-23]|uniref:nucleoside hydrolase n=1 Tax=Alexandriicola marinus TaxID=2081710 RepID=UPI000FDB33A7|nr:nucleoside hydrolase [Alexandriicola marinus]MBM1221260.1 nucleoside hydrolase [Ponticoccus sp. SC6-9]MBM1225830.1 nucleoside hydrolase [Ponticoccus sp. SC6-15]MBM1227982.1 nucleoside hydrolase [Ponticoccus sp. SC6-38]MBM1234380.1 nucleoside hydrolase [Ponticoccus sp. SC6-45]MBM1238484.1 nucleoside hydrolase [Ponticoccus sp. SC6-49]MBM1243753.1 nucleoside hydrolase [Ponticoccus sp. SC2-64]MBM1247904.1 nucleoside hydrolase [Ponticoccus sp. SC6-42]MBM1252884.1 nucleoside hydrolase [Pontico
MTTLQDAVRRFTPLDSDLMAQRLGRPGPMPRVIIDTDTANEIDDQYAVAWAILSQDRMKLEGVTSAPYSFLHHRDGLYEAVEALQKGGGTEDHDSKFVGPFAGWAKRLLADGRTADDIEFVTPDVGEARSYDEIIRVFEACHERHEGRVFRGSPEHLPSYDKPVDSDAAQFIIDQARNREDGPVYILAMGALPNIGSALLMAPDIIDNIVLVWTAGFPSYAPFSNLPSLNLVQDRLSSRLVFECGVPQVYLPGYHVGAQLTISLPEMERFVKGRGDIGDYLWHLYTNNPLHVKYAISEPETKTWVIWDIINVAWLLDAAYVPTHLTTSPHLSEDLYWRNSDDRHAMLEAYDVNRDAVFEDIYRCLLTAPS